MNITYAKTRASRVAAICLCAVFAAPLLSAGQGRDESRRDAWQRVPDVIAALGVKDGSHVADVGAGDGYFTTRLSKAAGETGAVYAVDISSRQLSRLRARLEREGVGNVQTIEGATDDPRLPEGRLDAALIVNAYHEMTEHQQMLAGIRRALKPEGRLVILEAIAEQRRGASREVQERTHELEARFVQDDLAAAGFRVLRFEEGFTTRPGGHSEWIIVASPTPLSRPVEAPVRAPDPDPDADAWLAPAVRIDLAAARTLFDAGGAIFVDVRGPEMFEDGHVEGARMIDMGGLRDAAPALIASGKRVITYCS
jgi:predicted methyltransferase